MRNARRAGDFRHVQQRTRSGSQQRQQPRPVLVRGRGVEGGNQDVVQGEQGEEVDDEGAARRILPRDRARVDHEAAVPGVGEAEADGDVDGKHDVEQVLDEG